MLSITDVRAVLQGIWMALIQHEDPGYCSFLFVSVARYLVAVLKIRCHSLCSDYSHSFHADQTMMPLKGSLDSDYLRNQPQPSTRLVTAAEISLESSDINSVV